MSHVRDSVSERRVNTAVIALSYSNDPNSRVHALRQHKLGYTVLTDLGTRPRITYMAELRNPNAELEKA